MILLVYEFISNDLSSPLGTTISSLLVGNGDIQQLHQLKGMSVEISTI